MDLNCLEQARVGVLHERVSHRDVLITTMRYRTGYCNRHYLPGALDRMVVEAIILDEEAAAHMAIERVVGSGWNNWAGMAGGMV